MKTFINVIPNSFQDPVTGEPRCRNKFGMTKTGSGFTLIELLVVITVMAILSVIGIAAFVSYSHAQAVDTAVLNVKAMLQTARSDALSQTTTNNGSGVCANDDLTGYEISLCGGSPCPGFNNGKNNDYELYAVCGGTVNIASLDSKNLSNDSNIYFDTNSATQFIFNVLTGAVTFPSGQNTNAITIGNNYKITPFRTITVSSGGSITAN